MAYELRDNSGCIFNNDRKRPDSNDCDRTGKVMVGGKEYWCNGWIKEDKNGNLFLSLSFKEVGAAQGGQNNGPRQPAVQPPPKDDRW